MSKGIERNLPQSWNRYAYVMNNPLNSIDPLGLSDCIDGHIGCNCSDPSGDCSFDFFGSGNPGNGCNPADASCGGTGIGIGIGIGFGGRGGGGGTNPPIPPPNNPGTTFPGNPAGQIICVSIPGQNPVCVSTSNPNWFWTLFNAFWEHVPWAGAVFIPLQPTGNMISVTVPWAYLPASKTGCLGLGLSATTPTGKFVSGGPLTIGDLDKAKDILSSWGFSFGGQATPFMGVQAISNSSGSLGGATLATSTGLSGGFTWSKCGPIE